MSLAQHSSSPLKLPESSKYKTAPNNCPRGSLGELDKVKRHFNQGSPISVWLGMRASYKPKLGESGEVILCLMRNSSDNLKNVLPIGVYDGHVFLIMDIRRLAGVYACMCSLSSSLDRSRAPPKTCK